MSNTCTMFACCSDSDSRASSRNIATNFLFLVSDGRMRLIAMFFLNPRIDSATPRNTSAMPPAATRSVMRYRLSAMVPDTYMRTGTGADAITKAGITAMIAVPAADARTSTGPLATLGSALTPRRAP